MVVFHFISQFGHAFPFSPYNILATRPFIYYDCKGSKEQSERCIHR